MRTRRALAAAALGVMAVIGLADVAVVKDRHGSVPGSSGLSHLQGEAAQLHARRTLRLPADPP
jgi:hypothetical protein